MLEKMKELIANQLNAEAEDITEATSFKDEYGVEIPSEDLENLTTVGAVMEYLKDKGVEA